MACHLRLAENINWEALLGSVPADVQCLPYFHPNIIDSEEATKFVAANSDGGPGFFILRRSSKGDHCLAVTVSTGNGYIDHFNVQIERHPFLQYYLFKNLKFSSIQELCRYYSDQCITNWEQIQNVKLLYPIHRRYDDRSQSTSRSRSFDIPDKETSDSCSSMTSSSQQLSCEGTSSDESDEEDKVFITEPGVWPETRKKDNGNKARVNRPQLPQQGSERRQNHNVSHETVNLAPSFQRGVGFKKYDEGSTWRQPQIGVSAAHYFRSIDEGTHMIGQQRHIPKEVNLCTCGIPMVDTYLPYGWTLHMTYDANMEGTLCFQNAQGETSWSLPRHVVSELNATQCSLIRRLSRGNAYIVKDCGYL